MSTPFEPNQPAGRVVSVTMLGEFFERFDTWARALGFVVVNVPGMPKETFIVVPGEELMARIPSPGRESES